VLATRHLTPLELFLGVKLTEVFFHLRPRALNRLLFGNDRRFLQIMRSSMWIGIKVVLAEIREFFLDTRFVLEGSLKTLPGSTLSFQAEETSELELARRTL
jgi:hypothetical protein